mgnify:CR=1 FL=1
MKRSNPRHDVIVIERDRAGDTFGFGVVFSDATMAGIADADSEAYAAISEHLVHWDDIAVHYGGEVVRSTGHGFSGMSRHTLLRVLQTAEELMAEADPDHRLLADDAGPAHLLDVTGSIGDDPVTREQLDRLRPFIGNRHGVEKKPLILRGA